MGEIAEMMLNGEMCQSCGEWMGDHTDPDFEGQGFPGLCTGCAAVERREAPRPEKQKKHKAGRIRQR